MNSISVNEARTAKIQLIASMFMFGTIGIFVRYINLPSSIIAFTRGIIGTLFLLLIILLTRKKLSREAIKANLLLLCISGAFIGINWILLFESYRYTTVATATLCYYMAPIIVIAVSPLVLKEKLTVKKTVCIIAALFGMVLVSGILETGISGIAELKGILFGIGAAVFYACVVILNKKIKDISAYDKTILQLSSAAVVLIPYLFLSKAFTGITLDQTSVIMLAIVGIFHTGIGYSLYFGSMKSLSTHTIAIFSYIDPVVAIILSAIILKEELGVLSIIGAVLILGSTFISELPDKKK